MTMTLPQSRALEILASAPGVTRLSDNERALMTVRCRDADHIEKVPDAGSLRQLEDGRGVQVMHNGVLVEAGGYFGAWTAYIIRELRGHHEPQEEKVFHEVLQRIPAGGSMIELGCFWAYYSLWFHQKIAGARNVCCEPDPANLALGARNAALNGASMELLPGVVGQVHGTPVSFVTEVDRRVVTLPVVTVDGLMVERGWERLDLLHLDVQGAELDALRGARGAIRSGSLRFVFVSTHHWSISGNPDIHADCLRFFERYGGHVVASHTVAESYSGDGLIVASFDAADTDFHVETSLNHTDQSLFRPYEEDLAILARALA